jgi:beta-galactosidase
MNSWNHRIDRKDVRRLDRDGAAVRPARPRKIRILPALSVLLLAGLGSANITERRENQYLQARTKTRIDEGWKILVGSNPSGAQNTAFSDAGWTTTNVPYDMANALVGTGKGTDPGQKGWFRKHFTVPTGTAGKQVIVQFDGVYHDAVVYINGTQVASQEYGYVSFKADITKYLNLTGDNVLAVWVDNLTVQTSRWYSGSGIFRHVWLITTDPVHVKNWGTAITTAGATAASSTVKINTEVTNETSSSASRTLVTVICDSTGKRIDSVSTPITVAANTTTKFPQSIAITGCNLWSPTNPYVYNAYTKIMNGTTLADDYVTPFGIRDITYSTSGLFINGVNTKMKGICMHQTMVPVGSAVPEQMWARVIKQLQAAGVNSIRTSHCPMEPEFYDLCDKMGMLVMDEWCDKWKTQWAGSYYQDYDNVWQADLTLFLERDRNHPCIYIWSYGNEVDPGSNGSVSQYEFTMSGTIVPFAKAIDASRPYTHAVANGFSADWPGYVKLAQYEDIVGVNYNDGGYATGIADGPNVVWIGTEQYPYGTTWNNCKSRPQVLGEHIWTGMDYLGEVSPMGENSGFLDDCAFRKTWFYYRKAIIGTDPVVKLGVGSTSTSGAWVTPTLSESWNQSGSQNVVAYSNCQSVSLYLNGSLVGTKTYSAGTPSVSQWTVNWASGTLKVVGSNNGTQAAVDSLITVGAASKVVIQSDRTTLYADGDDVANLDVYITDANGNHVWNATNTLTYTVTGNGRSYGIGTGDLTVASNFTGNSHAAYEGRAYIPVQSTTTPGSITVNVTANGLAAGSIALTTVPQPAGGTTSIGGRSAAVPEALSFDLKSGLHSVEMDYQLNQPSPVRISVLLPDGRTVEDFNEGTQSTGAHSWSWAGIPGEHAYFVRLQADGRSTTKMLVVP